MANIDDLQEVKVTARRSTASATGLSYMSFPTYFTETRNGNQIPYVLFKIFKTDTEAKPDRNNDYVSNAVQQIANPAAQFISSSSGQALIGAIGASSLGSGVTGQAAAAAISAAGGLEAIGNEALRTFDPNLSVQGIGNLLKDKLNNFTMKRNVSRIDTAIALPMPENLAAQYDQAYQELSMTQILGVFGALGQAMASKKAGAAAPPDPFVIELGAALAARLPTVGSGAEQALLFGTTGLVVNPQLEMVYTSPILRKFVLNFILTPKNAQDADRLFNRDPKKGVIAALKYYSAPEIPTGNSGRYFIPPHQFEIEFYNGAGKQNPYIFKSKKCVLNGLSVDYAPAGFATHSDGTPAQIALQLQFQETSIISKADIEQDNY